MEGLVASILNVAVIFFIVLFSIVLHEIAHGYAALKFGDSTAKDQGRLTLNPIVHIDPFGSIILPAILYFIGAPILAWAKPVPVNFRALWPRRLGMFVVSIAGVVVNISIAILGALVLRLVGMQSPISGMLSLAVLINLVLFVFNLMPIPPLDGSRLWMMWLPEEQQERIHANTFFFFFMLIMLIPYLPVGRVVYSLFTVLTGFALK